MPSFSYTGMHSVVRSQAGTGSDFSMKVFQSVGRSTDLSPLLSKTRMLSCHFPSAEACGQGWAPAVRVPGSGGVRRRVLHLSRQTTCPTDDRNVHDDNLPGRDRLVQWRVCRCLHPTRQLNLGLSRGSQERNAQNGVGHVGRQLICAVSSASSDEERDAFHVRPHSETL